MKDEGAVSVLANMWEKGFHLVHDTKQVRINRPQVDEGRLIGYKKAESFGSGVDVEVMQFTGCEIRVMGGSVRQMSGHTDGHTQ